MVGKSTWDSQKQETRGEKAKEIGGKGGKVRERKRGRRKGVDNPKGDLEIARMQEGRQQRIKRKRG